MNALIVLENGFEDNEALTTYDVLKRAGINIDSCSIYNNEIITQSGHEIKSKYLYKDIKNCLDKYDFLVLPGGRAVMQVLDKANEINDLVDYFYTNNKLICAICAAPLLIGKRGYFKDLKYTCFPGCDKTIISGKKGSDGVVYDGNFITATSMYYTIDFALKIVEVVLGKDKAKTVKLSLIGK